MYYIVLDGDNVGDLLEHFILAENIEKLKDFSQQISSCFNEFSKHITKKGENKNVVTILNGGDSLMLHVQDNLLRYVLNKIIQYFFHGNSCPCTVSVGVGKSLIDAYLALKFAKSTGKNKIVLLNNINIRGNFEVLYPSLNNNITQ